MVTGRRPSRPAGAALHVVMAVVAVLLLLASTMVALSTMNLNMNAAYHNGQVAQNEAEAAISRLLYALSEREHFGIYETEEFRGTTTPGFSADQCYHYLTFRKDRQFPYSVNNYDRTKPAGYLGRVVPPRMIHAIATGYCRGQYRTVEALLERPEFPYALASSGRVDSPGPLVARGTVGVEAFKRGEQTRPGHVISNSSSTDVNRPAVYIGKDATSSSSQTFISGSVQCAGLVKILDPATVLGGIRPFGDATRLPDIQPTSFNNAGDTGVVEISPGSLEGQTLDIMYHCSHDLTYTGGITLENAFLYVQGNLRVNGPVKGVGALVASGDVTVEGDTTVDAGNRVALLAGGDITLQGQGNLFQGLLYGRGNLDARNITVLGNAIINSGDTTKGNATLDKVTFVTNADASTIQFTSTSSTDAVSQQTGGDLPFSIGGVGLPPANSDQPPAPGYYHIGDQGGGGLEGWYTCDNPEPILYWWTRTPELAQRALTNLQFDNLDSLRAQFPDAGNVFDALDKIKASTEKYQANQARITANESRIKALSAELKRLEDKEPPDPGAARVEREINQLTAENEALAKENAELQRVFVAQMRTMAEAYVDYYKKHAGKDGRYKKEGKRINVSRKFEFDLSKFLPVGDQLKVRYWHVFHGRL